MNEFTLIRSIDTINYHINLFKKNTTTEVVDDTTITNIVNGLSHQETPYDLILLFSGLVGIAKIEIFDLNNNLLLSMTPVTEAE